MGRIIGKILGSFLGLIFAGSTGAILGFIIGHLHDVSSEETKTSEQEKTNKKENNAYEIKFSNNVEKSAFLMGIVILGAKMAKADGRVSREEIAMFKKVFRIPDSEILEVGRIFDQAKQTTSGYEPYASRLAHMFRYKPAVLEEILTGLFLVAAADNVGLSLPKVNFLRRIATLFGFSEEDFMRIAARSGVSLPGQGRADGSNNPFNILGIPETATATEIKKTYRALIRKHHPDKLISQGLPQELISQANEKMKRINAAYAAICKQKGIK